MTALEKLIKLASTDASSLYRETGVKACEDLMRADAALDNMQNACLDNMEGANGDEFKYQESLLNALQTVREALRSGVRPSGIGSCTPSPPVSQ